MSWNFCKVDGCNNLAKVKGWCSKHYQQFYKHSEDYKPLTGENLRVHPLYIIWWQRKRDDVLSEEWLDFKRFILDVSPKPDGNYFLLRKNGKEPYGPNNFRWQLHLQRQENESNKDWHARKRAARILANPSMESERNLKRKYNLTKEQYNEKLKLQNFVCAICEQPETSYDARTGSNRNLAVDHCHNSNQIRELLCWRCNGTLGKIEDNIELLQKMIDYLNKHKETW